jgi:hypothetical protein
VQALIRFIVWVFSTAEPPSRTPPRIVRVLPTTEEAVEEQGRRLWVVRLAGQVPPPIVAEGDTLASVEARREALIRLYGHLHTPCRN